MSLPPQKRRWGFWDFILLIPSIPVFFFLLCFSERRDPWRMVRRLAVFVVKSFLLFMAVWIVFGFLTVFLDRRHLNVESENANPGYARCFPTTQLCSSPNMVSYGPLVWVYVHGPMVPLGMASVVGRELGRPMIERRIHWVYWNTMLAMMGHGSIFTWQFLRLGVYLYLSLLFLPFLTILWLYFTVKGHLR